MPRLSILVLLVAVMLGGCATRPVPEVQPVTLPQRWAGAPSKPDTHDQPTLSPDWWMALADPQLNGLVMLSLEANADIAMAAARLEQARASAESAAAERLPRLDAGGSVAHERLPRSSLPDSEGGRVDITPFRKSRFMVQPQASYEIDLLGRLALRQQSAEAEQAASEADILAVRRWLAHGVVLAYADVRIADDQQFDNRRAQMVQRLLVQFEERRLSAGLGTRETLREERRKLASLMDSGVVLRRDRELAQARLAALQGKAPIDTQIEPVDGYFRQLGISGTVSPGLPASVIAQRADVAAAWQRVVAAGLDAKRTRLERYPTLTLIGTAGYVSETLRRWLTGDALAWVAQAVLQTPLLDGGRNEARTRQAIEEVQEQHASYRKTVLQALAEVEGALSEALASKTRVDLVREEQGRRAADRDAVRATVKAGTGSQPELLQAELAVLDAEIENSLRRHELLVAWAGAQKALGR